MANDDLFYGDVAGFKAYFVARDMYAVPIATLDDTEILAALIVASEWLDARYGPQFSGTKVGLRAQIREQPRNGQWDINYYTVPSTAIPREVLAATYEAAFRQAINPGSLSLDYKPNKYRRVSIDGAITVEYSMYNAVADIQTQFAIIGEIMWPLLTGYGISAMSGLSGYGVRI